MDSQTSGPSWSQSDRRNIFESFANDDSDEDGDFPDISHVSDDSALSSSEDEDLDLAQNVNNDWRRVTPEDETDRPSLSPQFTVRNINSPKNIPDGLNNPLDVFSLFFDDDILDSIVTCANDYATHLLSQPDWRTIHPLDLLNGLTKELAMLILGVILGLC